jgi:hypothetical protein
MADVEYVKMNQEQMKKGLKSSLYPLDHCSNNKIGKR